MSFKDRFKIGDKIRITKRPDTWSSHIGDKYFKYPLDLKYPLEIIIKDLAFKNENNSHVTITDGKYGWAYKKEYKDIFELVESKKVKKWYEKLKKDDYVISLVNDDDYKKSYVFKCNGEFKLHSDYITFYTYLDCKGSTTNGYNTADNKFRLATAKEAAMYEHANKPVDITTYKIPNEGKEWEVGTWAVVIKEDYLGSNNVLKNKPKMPIGHYDKIAYNYNNSTTAFKNNKYGNFLFEKDLVKWFATEQEAKEFSESLKKPDKFKVGDWVWSNCPNINKKNFNEVGGVIGKLLTVENNKYKVKVLKSKYPFYTDDWVWCYNDITRLATLEEIESVKSKHITSENGVELIPGTIYKHEENGNIFIERFSEYINGMYYFDKGININNEIFNEYCIESDTINTVKNCSIPSKSDIDWINVCIKAGKYIDKDEALELTPKMPNTSIEEFKVVTHSKYSIGDKVEITKQGHVYSNYKDAFKAIGFNNCELNPVSDRKGTIFSINKHPSQDDTLISINLNNGEQVLMGVNGIEHYKPMYKFNKGDLVVITEKKGKTDWNGWWIEPGEIIKLGGKYWKDSNLEAYNKGYTIDACSKQAPSGNGAWNTETKKSNFKMRHATKEEIEYFNKVGYGANIVSVNHNIILVNSEIDRKLPTKVNMLKIKEAISRVKLKTFHVNKI